MIVFEQPFFLFLIIPLPLSLYLRYFWKKRGGRVNFSMGTGSTRQSLFTSWQPFFRFFWILGEATYWLTIFFLILALSGVSYTRNKRIFMEKGMDIMVVLDESPSMSGKDFPGSRFEAAKQVVHEFIDLRENDVIGLVSVGAQAVLRVPLTMNAPYLQQRLKDLQVGTLNDGTALGRGISLAVAHLEECEGSDKVILLLTDGENTDTLISPYAAAEAAKELGIRIYAVGMGTTGTVEFEYTKEEHGQIITGFMESRFDEKMLTSIAQRTGGQYFPAASVRGLSESIKKIDLMERVNKAVMIETQTTPLSPYLILGALLSLIVSFLIRKLILKELL